MNISYVTSSHEGIASYRYRIYAPSQVLASLGHEISISPKANPESEVVVFSKHWSSCDIAYSQFCRARGQTVIYDICDDHFGTEERKAHYYGMMKYSDVITVNSEVMGQIVKAKTGRDAVIIRDPVLSKPQSFRGGAPRLCWYGSIQNIKGLYEVYPEDCPVPLEISIPGRLEPPDHFERDHIIWSQWNPHCIEELAERNNIALLPYRQGREAKSANRILEALQSGMYVIADDLPAARGLPGVWDLKNGLREGILNFCDNQPEVAEEVAKAQEMMTAYYPDCMAKDWLSVFQMREGIAYAS